MALGSIFFYFIHLQAYAKEEFDMKMKMKPVAGREVVYPWVERRETEARGRCGGQRLKTENNLYTHSFNLRLSVSILFCSFKI